MTEPASTRPASGPAVARIVDFFEHLAPADLARIDQIYAADASFKDPFNEVRGCEAVAAIFRHMFEQVIEPRFIVHDRVGDEREVFLTWDFEFRRARGDRLQIRGASHLRLDDGGRITWHRDYWDAAEELYEKLPIVGTLMRWLKRRAAS